MAHLKLSSAAEQRILSTRGVVGVGHSGPDSVEVNVRAADALPHVKREIGSSVEGFDVSYRVTGNIKPPVGQIGAGPAPREVVTRLLRMEGVVSVARDNGRLIVGVADDAAAGRVRKQVGQRAGGLEVVVTVTDGFLRQQLTTPSEPLAPSRKSRHRPVPMGVSIGHVDITAGTSSYPAITSDGETVITSNNHVLAAINQGSEGDPILQPGPYDGGTVSGDQVGALADYVPVKDGATVDVAWATPSVDTSETALDLGAPESSVVDPKVGDALVKSGRSSGVSKGEVLQTGASINVDFGPAGTITMREQVVTQAMLIPGDSGSPGLREAGGSLQPAGLGFAGSSEVSIFNEAANVEQASGLTLLGPGLIPDVPIAALGVGGFVAGGLAVTVFADEIDRALDSAGL